jgi:hypothetical protein
MNHFRILYRISKKQTASTLQIVDEEADDYQVSIGSTLSYPVGSSAYRKSPGLIPKESGLPLDALITR